MIQNHILKAKTKEFILLMITTNRISSKIENAINKTTSWRLFEKLEKRGCEKLF